MAEQGKCTKCKIRWTWKGHYPIKKARCIKCGSALKTTTHLLKYPEEKTTRKWIMFASGD